jgi:hypothetical protein
MSCPVLIDLNRHLAQLDKDQRIIDRAEALFESITEADAKQRIEDAFDNGKADLILTALARFTAKGSPGALLAIIEACITPGLILKAEKELEQ